MTQKRRWLTAASVFLVYVAVAAQPAAAQGREPYPGLDAYIANAVQTWKIPGLAVGIVRNDSVIYAKGFGVLSSGSKTPVNERTLFEIGSSSKAFTATLVAMLVSDGKMAWTNGLRRICPISGCTIPSPTKASRFATRCRIAAASRAVSSSGWAPASRVTRCCIAFGSSSQNRRSDRSGRIRT